VGSSGTVLKVRGLEFNPQHQKKKKKKKFLLPRFNNVDHIYFYFAKEL
jgi:hypothetical protein